MNPDTLIRSFSRSISESHDYKPPRETVKSPIFGRLLAGWIFIWRITSFFQFIKALYKTAIYYSNGSQTKIHPLLAELYLAGTLLILFGAPYFLSPEWIWANSSIIFIFCAWKAFETLSASLYYHAFRDFFEIEERISGQRSFLLSIADLAVICLCTSYVRALMHGTSYLNIHFGSAEFLTLPFAGAKELHFDILLSTFVWLQITIALRQGIGFLNSKKQTEPNKAVEP